MSQEDTKKLLKSRFVLLEKIGSGGMGVVYKALDLLQQEAGELNPWVAIKLLRPGLIDKKLGFQVLHQEVKKLQSLSHPHVVNVFSFDRCGDHYFFTMEWIDGISLDQLIQFDVERVKAHRDRWEKELFSAIEFSHYSGIVHSDIKPQNIIIDSHHRLKIIDFGIARILSQSVNFFSENHLRVWTPAYASLNTLMKGNVSCGDDFYSLGCVTYMLYAYQHPYQHKNAMQIMHEKIQPKKPDELSWRRWNFLKELIDPASDSNQKKGFENFLKSEDKKITVKQSMIVFLTMIALLFSFLGMKEYAKTQLITAVSLRKFDQSLEWINHFSLFFLGKEDLKSEVFPEIDRAVSHYEILLKEKSVYHKGEELLNLHLFLRSLHQVDSDSYSLYALIQRHQNNIVLFMQILHASVKKQQTHQDFSDQSLDRVILWMHLFVRLDISPTVEMQHDLAQWMDIARQHLSKTGEYQKINILFSYYRALMQFVADGRMVTSANPTINI